MVRFFAYILSLLVKYKISIRIVALIARYWGKQHHLNNKDNKIFEILTSPDVEIIGECIRTKLASLNFARRRAFFSSMVSTYLFRDREIPLAAFIDVTYRCNLHCEHCINKSYTSVTADLPIEHFKEIMQKLREIIKIVFISGGEPLMRKDILSAIGDFPEFYFIIFTNGTYVDEHLIDAISETDNVAFIVSIDGDMITHEKRKGKGMYEYACNSVRTLVSNGILCGISTVLNSNSFNLLQSSDYYNMLNEFGAHFLVFMGQQGIKVDDIKQYIVMSKARLNQIRLPTINVPYDEISFSYGQCVGGKAFFHINVDGNISRCPFVFENLGNIFASTKEELLRTLRSSSSVCAYSQAIQECKHLD